MKNGVDRNFVIKLVLISIMAFVILNFSVVANCFNSLNLILRPIYISFIFTLILIIPTEFIENKILKKLKHNKLKRILSVLLSLTIFIGVIFLILWLAIPTGVKSIALLIEQLSSNNYLNTLTQNNTFLHLIYLQAQKLLNDFLGKTIILFPKILDLAQSTISCLAHILIGLFISIMLIINKEQLRSQLLKLLSIYFKKSKYNNFFEILEIAINKFSRYLGGQILEAIILGSICYVGMRVLNLPYPALVAIIVGFFNLIPIVGAYIGGTFSAIIIFAISPIKAVIFVVFVLILQQLESVTTYPLVVGKYVGLNGFWVIVSIIIWGGIFGFWGILLGVPLTAFLQEILRRKYLLKQSSQK
ncbi:MAG: AI-2E family transporter [Clostridia bacterium]